jgi:subtilisin family serine protease
MSFPAGRYVGMAPGAELIAVQASRDKTGSFVDADVLGAASWVVDAATTERKPVVLNLSLGGPGGPHDGTSSLEKGLDEIFPPDGIGRTVVVAAGNDGAVDLHAGKSMLDGELVLPVELGKYTDANGQVMIEIWYTGTLELAAETPGGVRTSGVAAGGSLTTEPIVTNHINEGKIVITQDADAREDGRRTAGIALVGATDMSPTSGTWKLHIRGQATRFDAWVVDSPPSGAEARFTQWVDTDERIGLPGTAHNAIVVGSFGSRNEWVTVDGMDIMRPNVVGDASPFSSSGPSADGRFLPDVLAPGEFIISALSRDAPPDMPGTAFFVPSRPTFGWADDGVHAVLRGTSQASPHVTGVIALLYQIDPSLTPLEIREILRTTANPQAPGYTPREGFGHVDALAAVRYLRGLRGTGVDANMSSIGLLRDLLPPGDSTTTVTVTPRDANGAPLGTGHDVSIEASAGDATGPVVDVGWGRYERTFAAHAPRGTAARVTAVADGIELATHPTFYIAADRTEIGNNFVAAGGCSASPGVPVSTAILVVAAILLARYSRRRRPRSTLEP